MSELKPCPSCGLVFPQSAINALRAELEHANGRNEHLVSCLDAQGNAIDVLLKHSESLKAELKQVKAVCQESNEVCLCGCPMDVHETDEGGVSCEREDHECVLASEAGLSVVERLRAELAAAKETIVKTDDAVQWWVNRSQEQDHEIATLKLELEAAKKRADALQSIMEGMGRDIVPLTEMISTDPRFHDDGFPGDSIGPIAVKIINRLDAECDARANERNTIRAERDRLLPLARFAAEYLSYLDSPIRLYSHEHRCADRSGMTTTDDSGAETFAPGIRETIEELRRG